MEKDFFKLRLQKQEEGLINCNKEIQDKELRTKLSLRKAKIDKIFSERRIIKQSSPIPIQQATELSSYDINGVLSFNDIINVFMGFAQQSNIVKYRAISSLRKSSMTDLIGVNNFIQKNIIIQRNMCDYLQQSILRQKNGQLFTSSDIELIYEVLLLMGNLFCFNHNPLFLQLKEANFITVLIDLLYFPHDAIIYQTVFCLCNMLPEGAYFLDAIGNQGAFVKVVKLLKEKDIKKDQLIIVLGFIYSYIKLAKKSFEDISCCLQNVANHISSTDEEIQLKSLYILQQITHQYSNSSSAIIQTGCLKDIKHIIVLDNDNNQYDFEGKRLAIGLVLNIIVDNPQMITKMSSIGICSGIVQLFKNELINEEVIERILIFFINIKNNESVMKESFEKDDELIEKLLSLIYPQVSQEITSNVLSLIYTLIVIDMEDFNMFLVNKGICVQLILLLKETKNMHSESLVTSACLIVKIINKAIEENNKSLLLLLASQIESNDLTEIINKHLLTQTTSKFQRALNLLNQSMKGLLDIID